MYGPLSSSPEKPSPAEKSNLDLEAGGTTLYPGLSYADNQLRWAFIRNVYCIISAQLLLTAVISAVFVFYSPVNDLLQGNLGVLLSVLILPFLLLWPLRVFQQRHPWNFVFLGLFTVCLSISIGVCCAITEGKTVLEAVILTGAVVTSLTGYTFWASKKGKDFKRLGPILLSCLIILVITGFIQLFYPLGPISVALYSGIGAMVFSGMVVYDTDNLIKRFTYDEYIWASVTLYLDILNLFLKILRMLRGR